MDNIANFQLFGPTIEKIQEIVKATYVAGFVAGAETTLLIFMMLLIIYLTFFGGNQK